MKRVLLVLMACWMLVLLSGCANAENIDNNITMDAQASEPINDISDENITEKEPDVKATKENDYEETAAGSSEFEEYLKPKADIYEGEYNDYEVNEPALEIRKNADGTYTIQISIFRLAYLDDGVGELTDNGISFSATAPSDKKVSGTIVLEEDVATVTFTSSEWSEYSDINEYRYYKVSDISNIYEGDSQ